MFDDESRVWIAQLAKDLNVEPTALMAIVEVESGGRIFARVAGRHEPLIRFEGHYFDRLLPASARERAVKSGLASPKAGKIANTNGRQTIVQRIDVRDRAAVDTQNNITNTDTCLISRTIV